MRAYILILIGISIGVFAGQKAMSIAYNPDVLEENALLLAKLSYVAGCSDTHSMPYGECLKNAYKYQNSIEEFWKNKLWRKL